MSNDYVWRQDIESGEWYQIRREEAEEIEEAIRRISSMVTSPSKGHTLITSPFSENDSEARKLWNESEEKPVSGLVKYFTPSYQPDIDKFGNHNT